MIFFSFSILGRRRNTELRLVTDPCFEHTVGTRENQAERRAKQPARARERWKQEAQRRQGPSHFRQAAGTDVDDAETQE